MVVSGVIVVAGFWALASAADEDGALQSESALGQVPELVTEVKGTTADVAELCEPRPGYLAAWQLVTQLNRLKAGLGDDTSASGQPDSTSNSSRRMVAHLEFIELCRAAPKG